MDFLLPAEQTAYDSARTALNAAPPASGLRVAAALVQDAAYRRVLPLSPDRLLRLVALAAELERLAAE
jgi:hypothetical protein